MLRKMKGGWDASEAASVASEEVQKFLTQYEGAAKANTSEYILLSTWGKVGANNNGGDEGSADGGRGCVSV